MANGEHLRIIKKGVAAWNEWRNANPGIKPNLSQVDLRKIHFREAHLREADLRGAILNDVDLIGADLNDADLGAADLFGTDLGGADLGGADLRSANLIGANLIGAILIGADLTGANLGSADLNHAIIGWTVFADVDLSQAKGLDTVKHEGPSTIGIDTLYQSGGKINEFFLRGCGVPDEFISYIPSLIGAREAIRFYSCFISHSAKDKLFCERLHADLHAKKVRVWYFPEDAKWGNPVWREIDESIRVFDKLVVVCSKNSLQSGPVQREIQRALNREDREARNILFPIRVDDYIFNTWQHERKDDVISKVVGDFTGWNRSATKYEAAFNKLLGALQASDSKT